MQREKEERRGDGAQEHGLIECSGLKGSSEGHLGSLSLHPALPRSDAPGCSCVVLGWLSQPSTEAALPFLLLHSLTLQPALPAPSPPLPHHPTTPSHLAPGRAQPPCSGSPQPRHRPQTPSVSGWDGQGSGGGSCPAAAGLGGGQAGLSLLPAQLEGTFGST